VIFLDIDTERNTPRSFTGLTDYEWRRFKEIIDYSLGRGKRSLFTTTMVRKFIENSEWTVEYTANMEQRAQHAINGAMGFFRLKNERKDLL
jgi:hypothetical protein